ncbi:MAG TPA: type II toxin-antitoxin system YafQ family toxin [Candidatus Kapabacteria bacterium]|jgi:mRNA interferase YafQ
MLKSSHGKRFAKDFQRMSRRNKSLEKFHEIARLLSQRILLEPKHRDHKLSGEYEGHRECHIEPDWLLIYRYIGDDEIRFERTGTHADLFE